MKSDSIGKNIRYYRTKQGLTQQLLADKIGVTWEMVSRYERGESSSLARIEGISKALKIPISELLQNYDKSSTLVDKPAVDAGVPLFVNIPMDFDFSQDHSIYYYSCPEWIAKKYPSSIAIDCSNLKIKSISVNKKGILYVAVGYRTSKSNVCFVIRNAIPFVINKKDLLGTDKYIGAVVAQEVSFV